MADATERGLAVDQVITEVDSGVNGHRRKHTTVLSDPAATVLAMQHRNRPAQFGFKYLQALMGAYGRRAIVLDEADTSDDLAQDITEILTSRCARRYGRRWAPHRAAQAVAVTTGQEPA